jgi:hypothetical protein
LSVNGERIRLLPFGRGPDRADQFHQRFGIADARDIVEGDRMFGQKRGGDDRQGGVFVAGRHDRAGEPMAAFDDVLDGWH